MNPNSIHPAEPSVLRASTLATRLSFPEVQAVAAAAKALGQTRSQWLRDAALAYLSQFAQGPNTSLQTTLLAELRGLRLAIADLFLNAGLGIPTATVSYIMANADSVKYIEAAKALRSGSSDLPVSTSLPVQGRP
jgi:hypothetical protein